MLRCGYCEKICDNYEDWLRHLVSDEHQANLGVSETLIKHSKDPERNERSILMYGMNPKTKPFDVVCHFATAEPLSFVTDLYAHIFTHCNEKFYLLVYDQSKFTQKFLKQYERYGDVKVVSSMVRFNSKSDLTEDEWKSKLDQSFFYRRHESLKRKLSEMNWDLQMESLLKFVCLDQKGYELRETVIEELEALLRDEFAEATVNPFGSCRTWLADVNADLDVYIDALGEKGRGDLEKDKKSDIMKKVTKLLSKKYDSHNVLYLKTPRVPIIKLTHPSGLKVDLSFENCLAVQNSKMIQFMTKLDYRVRRLLIFLRYWANYHYLIGPNSFKSYALIMMAFTYLRREKILPSVHELQNVDGVNAFTVCNWNATYCYSRELAYKQYPWLKACREQPDTDGVAHEVMKLAYGFFTEFSTFDFDKLVICPLTGTYISKDAFKSTYGKDLPCEMQLLKANLVTGLVDPFKSEKPMCVQDPFALNLNVTANCSTENTVYTFKAACSVAADALKPFMKTYGLAGTESFLELCCQPVNNLQKMAAMMSATAIENDNLDDSKGVITAEATSSTHEDDIWATTDMPISNPVAEAVIASDARKFSGDYVARETEKSPLRREGRRGRGRGLVSRRQDEEHFGGQTQSTRRSSQEEECKNIGDGFDYDPDRYSRFYDDGDSSRADNRSYLQDDDNDSRNTMKSSVNVASKTNLRSEVTSSCSPNYVPRDKMRNEHSRNSSSSNKTEKSNRRSGPYAITQEIVARNTCSSNNKNDIVVVLSNNDGSNQYESMNANSAPVPYNNQNQTVKFDGKVQPVVKYVDTPATVPPILLPDTSLPPPPLPSPSQKGSLLPPPPPPPPPPPVEEEMEEDDYEEEEEVDEFEEVQNFLSNLHQIAPPDQERFDDVSTKYGNYGYDRAVAPNKQNPKVVNVKTQPYVPPPVRRSISTPPTALSRPILLFPAFSLFMSDDFQQQFQNVFLEMNSVPEVVKTLKMKVLWVNAVSDFFSENNFWSKFGPLFPVSSLNIKKINETEIVLQMASKRRSEFLQKDSHYYTLINSGINRKRVVNEPGRSNQHGPNMKIPRSDFEEQVANNPWEYQRKSDIMQRLAKIPANMRKPYATAYYFDCRPEVMDALHSRWMDFTNNVSANVSCLDTFSNLCNTLCSSGLSPIPRSLDQTLLKVRLLVAVDTSGDIPGVYFGFETMIPQDHPDFSLQEDFNSQFEQILKDLLHSYVIHRLQKYFKVIA